MDAADVIRSSELKLLARFTTAGTTFEEVLPQTLYQRDVSDSAVLTTYQSAHTASKKKLLRMDRYGLKHVELTPVHQ